MSRGLGALQRAIVDALPAHEIVEVPGVYSLYALRETLAKERGQWRSWIDRRYTTPITHWYVDPSFAASFARAVQRLEHRQILRPHYTPLPHTPRGERCRWRLPFVCWSATSSPRVKR
jgi:hypothetical protein